MNYKLVVNTNNPPTDALIVAELLNEQKKAKIAIEWKKDWKGNGNLQLLGEQDQLLGESNTEADRYFGRTVDIQLYGGTVSRARTEIDHWFSYVIGPLTHSSDKEKTLSYLDGILVTNTWLVSKKLTLADIHVFSALMDQDYLREFEKEFVNITRWYKQLLSLPAVTKVLSSIEKNKPKVATKSQSETVDKKQQSTGRKQEGKFIDLPGAEMGKVVVRFPPEASGYLHIGHAKAALLNQYYANAFQGQLIMRFDDTNPAKENVEFEQAILHDLELLQIKPDRFTHSSDYFDLMLEYCTKLIQEGKAFVDDTPADVMKEQRDQKLPSANRDNPIEQNLKLWNEMQMGTEKGQECCVRAKIDYQSANGCLRDPTIYRCKPEPHPRTGTKYKVYPTYDFACPIVDAVENVTHTLRTTEYHDRDAQFYWIIDALGLRRPYIWEYSRLNMTHTVLSKRKLTWFVSEGLVDGWDDPRFPTVRGILRRGMTVEGLKQFIIAQGSSRSVVFMEWDKIWSFNKKVIDPVAIRYTALSAGKVVPVHVSNAIDEYLTVPNHPKDPLIGTKQILTSRLVYIEKEDSEQLVEGQNATFINWGNLLIEKINRQNNCVTEVFAKTNLDNKDYKNTPKLTWLGISSEKDLIPCFTVYFDHIISKPVLGKDDEFKDFVAKNTRIEYEMIGEPELKRVKKGEIIQLQRKGYFICDVPYSSYSYYSSREQPLILFNIPDGHSAPAKNVSAPAVSAARSESPKENVNTQNASEVNEKIIAQGNKIRSLKTEKAAKAVIEAEVKILLKLKEEYKSCTGTEWKPDAPPKDQGKRSDSKSNKDDSKSKTKPNDSVTVEQLLNKIQEQGDKVRQLKSAKADKNVIDQEVKTLLGFKAEYKSLTGQDWKPSDANKPKAQQSNEPPKNVEKSMENSQKQGNKEKQSKKAKDRAGQSPADKKPSDSSTVKSSQSNVERILDEIKKQGDKVRELKGAKADKDSIEKEVKVLLSLKNEYKNVTGTEWKPPASDASSKKKEKESAKAAKASNKEAPKPTSTSTTTSADGIKTGTRLGLEVKKEENFFEWYSQIITKSGMIEYYDVSGCYILRPWSFAIWKVIKEFIEKEITKLGVQECYFPIFVTQNVLEKEKAHIADFAPEVAWVTKCGDSDLAEPIAIRPTSETVMYPAYAKWLRSDTELPLKLNQWNNVVRWEFKDPKPFLRTREFLWQEGHTAFATKAEADEEVLIILDMYAKVYEDLLAVPVVKGRKTEKEKFAGGDYTTTVEAFISTSGRAIQGATSHHLGQNFSKMFNIQVEGLTGTEEKSYVYQNSWGMTTRTVGVMIMVHGDDKGLVLPPNVACIQAIIIPCGITANTSTEQRTTLFSECNKLLDELKKGSSVRVDADYRSNRTPGWKFNHWELKGVPVRIELGPKDLEKDQVTFVRRDNSERIAVKRSQVVTELETLLNNIHSSMLARARMNLNEHIKQVNTWEEFCRELNKKNMLLSPFCGDIVCEDNIKADSARDNVSEELGALSMGAKGLCIPFEQPKSSKPLADQKCIHPNCQKIPKFYTLFGRSY